MSYKEELLNDIEYKKLYNDFYSIKSKNTQKGKDSEGNLVFISPNLKYVLYHGKYKELYQYFNELIEKKLTLIDKITHIKHIIINDYDNNELKKEFNDLYKEWISLDDKTKELKEQVKVIEERKKILSESIMGTMKSNEIEDLSLSTGGKLKAYTSSSVAPLKKENIFNNLMDEFKDEIKAEYLTSKIMDKSKREVKTNTVLKRYK